MATPYPFFEKHYHPFSEERNGFGFLPKIPQITCEAIFKNCLKQKHPFFYGGISYTVCNYYFQDVFTHGGGVGGVDSQCCCFAIVFGQYPFSVQVAVIFCYPRKIIGYFYFQVFLEITARYFL